jgi:Family of unknown function (DUF6519)
MKGDFSRIRFNPAKQYTAVLDLQGRVSLDADGNEQCAIDGYLQKTETVDVVGEYGGPINDAGFAITVDQDEILIGAGRYYVEGLMCENRHDNLPYTSQPYLIDPSPADSALLGELAQQAGSIQVFLQVWQRLVTALDDPGLREPALGQADTTARLQTVWRVIASFLPSSSTVGGTPPVASAGAHFGTFQRPPFGSITEKTFSAKTTNASALLVKETTKFTRPFGGKIAPTTSSSAPTTATASGPTSQPPIPDCCTQMYAEISSVSTGTMGATTGEGTTDCSCQPIPAAGYQGLENQLYRVEIHQPGDETTATLKWSRENGSVVAAITNISGTTVWVDSLGPDANLGFQANDWVEISDDTYLFGETPNQPGAIYQILIVDATGPSITLTTPAIPVDKARNARVRRWDQSGIFAGSNGVPLPVNTWQTLENGIQISFATGSYQSGDYWLIPARAASGMIEWPTSSNDGALFQSPHSIVVYNAPLACIHWDESLGQAVVEPCRRLFYPLTSLTPPATPDAIHITKYSWQNDDVMTFDQLLKSGLALTVDQVPTGPISGANFVVTVEALGTAFNTFFNREAAVGTAPPGVVSTGSTSALSIYTPVFQTLPLSSFILDWQTAVIASTKQITWQLPTTDLTGLQFRYLELINDNLLGALSEFGLLARVRVKLLGKSIFAQSGATQMYLDGESPGLQATRQDGKTPCISLQMPSGNGYKASDFEGWFYLAPFNSVSGLSMNFSAFTVVVDLFGGVTGVEAGPPGVPPQVVTPQLTVELNYPAATGAGATATFMISATTTGVNANSYVSLPPSVVVAHGASQATVNLKVFGNPGSGVTYSFQITASVQLAFGTSTTQSIGFTVTGVQAPLRFREGPILLDK